MILSIEGHIFSYNMMVYAQKIKEKLSGQVKAWLIATFILKQ